MRILTLAALLVALFAANARATVNRHHPNHGYDGHYNNSRPMFYNPYHYANPRQGIQAYEYVHPYHGSNPYRMNLWRRGYGD